jgi:competence protein ComEC
MDKPDRRMHLYFLDVGAGDSTLVVTPQGRHVLINGGSSPLRMENELGVHLPLFQKEIDWLILNGTGEHQLGGLTGIAQRYPIRNVLVCGSPGRFSYRLLMDQLSKAGIPIRAAQAGQWLDLGDGARLDIIPQGDRGCVLELSHAGFIWFTSSLQDLEPIRVITSQFQLHSPTVYLLPDGGNLGEDPAGLLNQINPWVSIASVEAGDPRGLLPAEGGWSMEGRELLRTDRQGTIHIQTNGIHVWAVTER